MKITIYNYYTETNLTVIIVIQILLVCSTVDNLQLKQTLLMLTNTLDTYI